MQVVNHTNKYPIKDPMDKLYRIGAGFSKMLKMVTPDSQRNKRKRSLLNEVFTSNGKKDIEEENISCMPKDKNNSINLENTSGTQMEYDINSIKSKLPNLLKKNNLKQNLTFTHFYNNENFEEINNKSNTGIHSNNIIVNNINKNKKKNIDMDINKDEVIHLSNSPKLINRIFSYETKKGPKIMKVYKKITNNSVSRKIIDIKNKNNIFYSMLYLDYYFI